MNIIRSYKRDIIRNRMKKAEIQHVNKKLSHFWNRRKDN